MLGVAIKIELYVPMTTPIIRAKINPLILSPPKLKMVNRTTNVESEVLMVRESVLFKASLINVLSSRFPLYRPTYSRIRSKTTTVSLIEYPMTVRIAAMKAWSISIVNGRIPQNILKIDSTINTSCVVAMSAPSPYCHFLKRKTMYRKIMRRENMVAFFAPSRKSSEMVESTLLYMSMV